MNSAQQAMYREEMILRRQRELAIQQQQQQQQLRERDARLEQQLYGQGNPDLFDTRGSFVSNDLVPGLRPPIQRPERDLYNSDRLGERLTYAAQGRVPGVPGNYDQMMRSMNVNAPVRGGGGNMYAGAPGVGGGGMPLPAEIIQQQQLQQQRERQRQLQRQQEIERAQLLAMQNNQMGNRNPSNIAPRQNLDQYNRGGVGGRIPVNDLQSQQQQQPFGYGGLGGPGGMNVNVNGGYGGNNQLNGFDLSIRQQQLGLQQQQQQQQQQQRQPNLGMGGYGGIGGVEPRYAQQNPLHGGGGMHGQGGNQPPDLMALLLAGNQQNQ